MKKRNFSLPRHSQDMSHGNHKTDTNNLWWELDQCWTGIRRRTIQGIRLWHFQSRGNSTYGHICCNSFLLVTKDNSDVAEMTCNGLAHWTNSSWPHSSARITVQQQQVTISRSSSGTSRRELPWNCPAVADVIVFLATERRNNKGGK